MRQFLTFAGVGAIGTAGHYTTLVILVELFGLSPTMATTAGFIVGAVINYILNYVYTFKSTKNHLATSSKFFMVAAATAGVNSYIMYLGVEVLQFYYLLVQVVATTFVLLINYGVNKFWTFADEK